MGMFDYVKCEYPLPEGAPDWAKGVYFQTHDTPRQFMENYTITAEGRLIYHSIRWETVPEEERPDYGKTGLGALGKLRGMLRNVPTGDVDTNYHGDLYLIASRSDNERHPEFWECVARFTNGQLEYIKPVPDEGA
jgi:hypothetical protein